ncbi:MAG: sigma-70 family RNA polymerase sigma factor [Magnetococcales bacterium]|nr:sigma-70 family RNA polymerase sigma factor [Magnetococcales bacterium]
MKSRNRYQGIDPYVVNAVHHHARQLTYQLHNVLYEVEDIEQELMADIHHRLPCFDATKASAHTFITLLIKNHVATMVEHTKAKKRCDGTPMASLNQPVTDEEGCPVELIDTVPFNASLWDDGETVWPETAEQRMDVTRHLQLLPSRLRSVAIRLMAETFTEISAATGVPRSSLYDAAARIRASFMSCGIKKITAVPTN